MVSGSHFFPKAPLLCVKWIPAWVVMSRKVICSARADKFTKQSTAKMAVATAKNLRIYLEAPEAARVVLTGRAATLLFVELTEGSGTETCSCTDWRSLLSSGFRRR